MYSCSRFCGQKHFDEDFGSSMSYGMGYTSGGYTSGGYNIGKVGEKVYGGTATVGRVGALIGAIIVTLFSIGLLIGGIYIVARKGSQTYQGTIQSANCTAIPGGTIPGGTIPRTTWDCHITVAYNGKIEDKVIMDSNKKYEVGQPYAVKSGVDIPKFIGWVLIGIAIFMLFVSWLWYGLTMRYKPLAAVVGVTDVVGAAKNIL
jgi:hypothetical protein